MDKHPEHSEIQLMPSIDGGTVLFFRYIVYMLRRMRAFVCRTELKREGRRKKIKDPRDRDSSCTVERTNVLLRKYYFYFLFAEFFKIEKERKIKKKINRRNRRKAKKMFLLLLF